MKHAMAAGMVVFMTVSSLTCIRNRVQARKCRLSVTDINVREISLTNVSFAIKLEAANPGAIEAVIDRMELYLEIEGRRAARVDVDAITVPPRGMKKVGAVVELPFSSIGMTGVGCADDRGRIRYRIAGTAFVRTALGEMRIPVTVSEN